MTEESPEACCPEACCPEPAEQSRAPGDGAGATGVCPGCRSAGQSVGWTTMAALCSVPLPARQEVWLCRDPGCELVYFGASDLRLRRTDLHVDPGFKDGRDGLVCYCFDHRRGEVEGEARATGSSAILEKIKARVRAGDCACEVRNPTGRCCLRDIQRTVDSGLAARSGS